jgi:hypothetical protein
VYSPYKEYSTEIAAAWEVLKAINARPYSTRKQFNDAVQWMVSCRVLPSGSLIDSSEILLRVEPLDICRAALVAQRRTRNET